ncbi:NAD kinase [Spirochaetota bacterium]|nr:NAD kinase [Spirochaetota bacterium]
MIVVIANQEKYDCLKLLGKVKRLLKRFSLPYQIIQTYPFTEKSISTIAKGKIYIILGGDGTILSAFKHFKPPRKQHVLAVNFGTMGYMAGMDEHNAHAIIENYLKCLFSPPKKKLSNSLSSSISTQKRFKEEKRFVLFTECTNPSKHITTHYALNETILRVADRLRPITIKVKINGTSIAKVRGDGVIIATPTGSTAYNLSVGGPILSPEIEAFVLTFISAHSLTIKPIVVARGDIVELATSDPTCLGIDGTSYPKGRHFIRCGLSSKPLTFIKSADASPYHRLKQKLHWGE